MRIPLREGGIIKTTFHLCIVLGIAAAIVAIGWAIMWFSDTLTTARLGRTMFGGLLAGVLYKIGYYYQYSNYIPSWETKKVLRSPSMIADCIFAGVWCLFAMLRGRKTD